MYWRIRVDRVRDRNIIIMNKVIELGDSLFHHIHKVY